MSYDASQTAAPSAAPVANEASASDEVSLWPVVAVPDEAAEQQTRGQLEADLSTGLTDSLTGDKM